MQGKKVKGGKIVKDLDNDGYAKGGSVKAKVPSTQGKDKQKASFTVAEGKGKLRGMGKATKGGKFSGCF